MIPFSHDGQVEFKHYRDQDLETLMRLFPKPLWEVLPTLNIAFGQEQQFGPSLSSRSQDGAISSATYGAISSAALECPEGVVICNTQTQKLLCISDTCHHRVQIYHLITGQLITTIGKEGTALGEFKFPTLMTTGVTSSSSTAAEESLLLLVSDQDNHRVQIFEIIDNQCVVKGALTGISSPYGLTVLQSSSTNILYVSEINLHRVLVCDLSTLTLVNTIGSEGGDVGQLRYPHGLAVLSAPFSTGTVASRLFVCEGNCRNCAGNHRIQVFDAVTGVSIGVIGAQVLSFPIGATISTSLNGDPDSATGVHNVLIVTDCGLHEIFLFDAISGDVVRSIGSRGIGAEQFNFPCGVASLRGQDNKIFIFVADQCNNRVQIVVS